MVAIYLLLAVGGGVLLLAATLKIQVVDGKEWRKRGMERETIERVNQARRGTIFSSDGKVLVASMPVCDLYLDLGRMPKRDREGNICHDKQGKVVMDNMVSNDSAFRANLPEVCRILNKCNPSRTPQEFGDLIMKNYMSSKPSRYLLVQAKVPYPWWSRIRNMEGWTRCVIVKTADGDLKNFVRSHVYGNMALLTLGRKYIDSKGNTRYTGLEGYYDSVLRGQDGIYRCRRLQRTLYVDVEPKEDSVLVHNRIDGLSIITTIDTRYQDIAENALREAMQQYGGSNGCAVLMEVNTGYVLACSNLSRDAENNLYEDWRNVAVSDMNHPGSTFKVVAMTSMLNDPTIHLDTSYRVRAGGKKVYGNARRPIDDGHGLATDTTNLAGVLARSSNIGMSELTWKYYRNRRNDFRKNIEKIFPFGKLHPDINAREYGSYVGKVENDLDFVNLSYGYSCTVTPLQMLAFYNGLANGGCMLKPLFCREILDGKRSGRIRPVVLNSHICSEETAKQMTEMLVGVVENGTGSNIRNSVYKIAGKTGTAEDVNDRSLKSSSFVGYFPADKPRYSCIVLVENTSIAGRHVAAPVFKQIADCVMAIDKELGHVAWRDSARVERPVAAKANFQQLRRVHQVLGLPFPLADSSTSPRWTTYDNETGRYCPYILPERGIVPNCKGMTIRDAMALLRSQGYKVRFGGQGKVVAQTPAARSQAPKGTTVTLQLGIMQ